MGHDRQEAAGGPVVVERVVFLSIASAVNGVSDSVAFAARRVLEKSAGEKAFALWSDGEFDWIIHASIHDCFNWSAFKSSAVDVGSSGSEGLSIAEGEILRGESALGPVNPAVAAEIWAVEIVVAVSRGAGVEPDLAAFADAIAIVVR